MGVPNTPVCTTQKGLHLGKHNEHISETLILENILQGQPGSNQQNIFFLSPKVGSSRNLLPEWLHMLNYVKTVFSYPSTPPLSQIFFLSSLAVGNHFFWKVFGFPFWEPLFLESFWASILGTTFLDSFWASILGTTFLESFWVSILGTIFFGKFLSFHFGNHFFGKFLGFHFGNHFFWKVVAQIHINQ